MKVLIVVSCILAAASAGFLGPAAAPLAYSAPLAAPIAAVRATPAAWPTTLTEPVVVNGVPQETPEVKAAGAVNAVATAEAAARNFALSAPLAYAAAPLAYAAAPLAYSAKIAAPLAAAPLAYSAAPLAYAAKYASPLALPVIGPNGVPIETPEVIAAKASHAAAHIEAKVRNGDLGVVLRKKRGIVGAAPLAAAAPLAYSAAYAPAIAAPIAAVRATPAAWPTTLTEPVVINGVPQETPEVKAAGAVNAVATAEAAARNFALSAPLAYAAAPLAYSAKIAAPLAAAPLAYSAAPLAYTAKYAAAPLAYSAAYPQHLPVIGPNGVPLDTPEVAAAKAAHVASHVEAKVRNGDLAYAAYL